MQASTTGSFVIGNEMAKALAEGGPVHQVHPSSAGLASVASKQRLSIFQLSSSVRSKHWKTSLRSCLRKP